MTGPSEAGAPFTTRPELAGTFGMVTSTHWIASAVGMGILEKGGNAFDAAAATAFVLNVVEPHLNGPLGEVPILVWPAGAEAPEVICGQGPAPRGATIAHYRAEGLDLVPGSGLLSAVIPGAFDAWMLMLRDHGRLDLREVLAPAIHYAEAGHPLLPRVAETIARVAGFFAEEWPSSAAVWTPGGQVPRAGALFRNPDLAAMWRRILDEAEAAGGDREARIEAARAAFYRGFVAEAVDRYLRTACVMDGAGGRRRGVLTGEDFGLWQASREPAIAGRYHGWEIWKCGAWTQGPTLLMALDILAALPVAETAGQGAQFVHLATEALKRAFADRDAYLGDPEQTPVPLAGLLSAEYGAARAAGIGETAAEAVEPGEIAGFEAARAAFLEVMADARARGGAAAGAGGGEPTMAHLTQRRGDTVHLDVIDAEGNMVAATPSGGWLQSNPVVPRLGVPLTSRAQMFWLREGLASSLAPLRRPRTTLTPSMARRPDGTRLAFGTPGGDQQDQWQLAFLLRLVHGQMNLQEAIDAPLFHTGHLVASFYPRALRPRHLTVEPALGEGTIAALRERGHDVEVAAPWTVGRLTAAARGPDGVMRAAATPRLMQAYAVGR